MTPIVLSAPRRANFLAEAHSFRPQGPNPLPELLEVAAKLAAHLAILEPLIKRDLAQDGYSFIEGLPIDPFLPDPPTDGQRPSNKTWVTELVLLAVADLLGDLPLGYIQECPELFTQVAPQKGKELALSNGGSLKPLGWHTDNSILKRPYRPEKLMLLGLTNDSKTPTFVASVEKALSYLSLRQQQVLFQDSFRVQLPTSFNLFNGKLIFSEARAIASETENGIEFAANFYAAQGLNSEAESSLSTLNEVFTEIAEPIVLTPGTLLVFDNHQVVHGRAPIPSGKRWIQRIFTRQDLTALREATNTDEQTFIFDVAKIVLE